MAVCVTPFFHPLLPDLRERTGFLRIPRPPTFVLPVGERCWWSRGYLWTDTDWRKRKYSTNPPQRHLLQHLKTEFVPRSKLSLGYTELFKMTVGVLTTCHTQYT